MDLNKIGYMHVRNVRILFKYFGHSVIHISWNFFKHTEKTR